MVRSERDRGCAFRIVGEELAMWNGKPAAVCSMNGKRTEGTRLMQRSQVFHLHEVTLANFAPGLK